MIISEYDVGKEPIISDIEFSVYSDEDIKKMSVCEVDKYVLYQKNIPNSNAVNDLRMGTSDPKFRCITCGRDMITCPGHTGNIELAWPCINAGFFDLVLKILRTVCFFCCRITLVDENIPKMVSTMTKKKLFGIIYNSSKSRKRCPHCGIEKPTYSKMNISIDIKWRNDALDEMGEDNRELTRRPFTTYTIRDILSNIPKHDLKKMGFDKETSRVENFIQGQIMVCPPSVRPSVTSSGNMRARGQDDLTQKYQEIVKKNVSLREYLKKNPFDPRSVQPLPIILKDLIEKLQLETSTLINNNIKGHKPSTQRSGVPLKTLKDRLSHKEGRIRGNLMGKRVDFSARSVISPDSNIDVDEIGVPESIACSLTIPETVTHMNIIEMRKCILKGAKILGGAEMYITPDKKIINLEQCNDKSCLNISVGGVVERYLRNGDVVIFNRQPSLHKMGMLGHRVRIMGGNTFRLNLCTVGAYNADFDGDEMNMHVPQSIITRIEVSQLMMVKNNIISPKSNKPVMGIVQDSLIGLWLLTRGDKFIEKKDFMDYMMVMGGNLKNLPDPAIVWPRQLWTGHQLVSMCIPEGVNLVRGNVVNYMDKPLSYGNTPHFIYKGDLLVGCLNKSIVGASSGGIIHIICNDIGEDEALQFMTDIQKVTNLWLSRHGFSVGISDCVVDGKVDEIVEKNINVVDKRIQMMYNVALDKHDVDLENSVSVKLSKILLQTGSIVQESIKKSNQMNRILAMINSGSKGNPINISQISGCVGQNCVDGKRIRDFERTLPHYDINTTDIESNGFVRSSYSKGLNAREFFLHAAGGREGLVDTAVKTALTGYMQRKIMKGQESITISATGAVVDGSRVIDFRYGWDGMDPVKIEKVNVEGLMYNDKRLMRRFTGMEFAIICKLRDECRGSLLYGIHEKIPEKFVVPVNLERLVLCIHDLNDSRVHVDESVFLDLMGRACSDIRNIMGEHTSKIFNFYLRYHLCYKNVKNIPLPCLKNIFENMIRKVKSCRAPFGEMVGSISAQSIGEPLTQMTLNTFHFAGVSMKNVTLGIPRFKELVEMSKNIKTPSLTIFVKDGRKVNLTDLIYVSIGSVMKSFMISDFESPNSITKMILDLENSLVPNFLTKCSRYGIQISMDKHIIRGTGLVLNDIKHLLMTQVKGCYVITTTEYWVEWNVIICVPKTFSKSDIDKLAVCVQKFKLSGIDGIESASRRQIQKHVVNDGDVVETDVQIIDTVGSKLSHVALIPWVNIHETYTNDIYEILDILGIEAATSMLFSELKNTISFDGSYVDDRHISVLVNTMTHRGFIMPMSRHGINRVDTNPLVRCSFEETVDVLHDVSAFSENDNFNGVTQTIMSGQLSRIGTGVVDLLCKSDNDKKRKFCDNDISTDDFVKTRRFKSNNEFEGNASSKQRSFPIVKNSDELDTTFFSKSVPEQPFYECKNNMIGDDFTKINDTIFQNEFKFVPSSPDHKYK